MSCVFADVIITDTEMPRWSVSTWRFVPLLPLSVVGLALVISLQAISISIFGIGSNNTC